MYSVIKDVLNRGSYDLNGMLNKINALWIKGNLNDEQYAELSDLARGGARVDMSINVLAKLSELEQRIIALEGKGEDTETDGEVAEFADGKWYYKGDKCTYKGKTYECTAPEGSVCVWSPEAYPAYWAEL